MKKYVYLFNEGNKGMRELLGGKGANLAEMTNIGLPVPQGFTITTEACLEYYANNSQISKEITEEILINLTKLESISGKKFNDTKNPLLVSVRSGARASMPGMMDTVLNLGLNDEVVKTLSDKTNNPRFAYDSYRRFIQMYADVVRELPKESFEKYFDDYKEKCDIQDDTKLTVDNLKEIINQYKENYKKLTNEEFPTDPHKQLLDAVLAVFRSWNNARAISYRRLNNIPSSWGTAVNVQEMVYGNSGENSGTGVAFTRNPSTGENKLYGEYLINAQGEDVVAGIRTPQPISKLETDMPEVYKEFASIASKLENHYHDMQDMEFTIEDGKLFMLQTRNGKRTAQAAIKIAVDMVSNNTITKEEAILRVDPKQLDSLLHPIFDEKALKSAKTVTKGLAASPGAATGHIYFSAEDAMDASKKGVKDIILARAETSPEDIEGMNIANGILTSRGGMTSHAAVVARGMGKCAICGCQELTIDENNKVIKTINNELFKEGDYLSLDGNTGIVYKDKIETKDFEIGGEFETYMNWVDEVRDMAVRANADTPKDAMTARKFGAEGIGLCRTEHMFFAEERILAFRKMIVADTLEEREKALEDILPYQRHDFEELFKVMSPYPVIIRYLDPPLHEFLPKTEEEIEGLAKTLNISIEILKQRIDDLKEFNPMMGHRGCRLAITYPEIAKMQTRAVIEAAINVKNAGYEVKPEIMIPIVGIDSELKYLKDIVINTANDIIDKNKIELLYQVGTMIEIPRAVITADKIAEDAQFFSFGTNDLTQMTFGFSRDDAVKFLGTYYEKHILEDDPFATIDINGVGQMIKLGVDNGRKTKKDLEIGICGEHGGEPRSIEFCYNTGFNYVSCSPYRVPIARLAAAQAKLKKS